VFETHVEKQHKSVHSQLPQRTEINLESVILNEWRHSLLTKIQLYKLYYTATDDILWSMFLVNE